MRSVTPALVRVASAARLARPVSLVAVALVAFGLGRPAAAQDAVPHDATPIGAPPARPAASFGPKHLEIAASGGVDVLLPCGEVLARYTFWGTPRLGIGVGAFSRLDIGFQGSSIATGGALSAAWRRPGRQADLVLRLAAGGADVTLTDWGGATTTRGFGFVMSPEVDVVYHVGPVVGLVFGARSTALVAGKGLQAVSLEATLGLAF